LPKFYTVKVLAEMFGKDEETIRRWINDGDTFPHAFKVKDGWYVPSSDVKRLMKPDPEVDKAASSRRSSKGFVRDW
jgi:predicted site-specific integrase-resolvase